MWLGCFFGVVHTIICQVDRLMHIFDRFHHEMDKLIGKVDRYTPIFDRINPQSG